MMPISGVSPLEYINGVFRVDPARSVSRTNPHRTTPATEDSQTLPVDTVEISPLYYAQAQTEMMRVMGSDPSAIDPNGRLVADNPGGNPEALADAESDTPDPFADADQTGQSRSGNGASPLAANTPQAAPAASAGSGVAVGDEEEEEAESGATLGAVNGSDDSDEEKTGNAAAAEGKSADGDELSEDEQRVVDELKARDMEVRQHEAAHQAAGGGYAGAASYSYQQGPDGKRYAVGGEVSIDTSDAETPEATVQKMRIVRGAALAPANPSGQDLAVAAAASQREMEASREAADLKQEEAEQARAEAAEKAEEASGEADESGTADNAEQAGQAAANPEASGVAAGEAADSENTIAAAGQPYPSRQSAPSGYGANASPASRLIDLVA